MPWRGEEQPTPVFLPGEFHGQRSLVGYSLWDCKELDTSKQLTLAHFSKEMSKHDFFFNKRKYTREIFKEKLKEVKEFDKITVRAITNSVGL